MRKVSLFLVLAASLFYTKESLAMSDTTLQKALFAGGCFWCVESDFDKVEGVVSTTSGYSGGHVKNPQYKEVTSGKTGHREVLLVEFDPEKVTYQKLLDVFWKSIDPLNAEGQFCDIGFQYTSAIYVYDDEQQQLAEASKKEHEKDLNQDFATEILPVQEFYPAEDYHQDYYKKNPIRYKYYRYGCGRDKRLEDIWGKS